MTYGIGRIPRDVDPVSEQAAEIEAASAVSRTTRPDKLAGKGDELMNYYAANVKAGYTFDPEDGRTTHRYRLAHGILQELGVSPRVEHYEMCHHHPKNRYVTHKEGGCWSQCKTIWPEWVTDDMFELAWTAADARQTLTGLVNRLKRLDGKAS